MHRTPNSVADAAAWRRIIRALLWLLIPCTAVGLFEWYALSQRADGFGMLGVFMIAGFGGVVVLLLSIFATWSINTFVVGK